MQDNAKHRNGQTTKVEISTLLDGQFVNNPNYSVYSPSKAWITADRSNSCSSFEEVRNESVQKRKL